MTDQFAPSLSRTDLISVSGNSTFVTSLRWVKLFSEIVELQRLRSLFSHSSQSYRDASKKLIQLRSKFQPEYKRYSANSSKIRQVLNRDWRLLRSLSEKLEGYIPNLVGNINPNNTYARNPADSLAFLSSSFDVSDTLQSLSSVSDLNSFISEHVVPHFGDSPVSYKKHLYEDVYQALPRGEVYKAIVGRNDSYHWSQNPRPGS